MQDGILYKFHLLVFVIYTNILHLRTFWLTILFGYVIVNLLGGRPRPLSLFSFDPAAKRSSISCSVFSLSFIPLRRYDHSIYMLFLKTCRQTGAALSIPVRQKITPPKWVVHSFLVFRILFSFISQSSRTAL